LERRRIHAIINVYKPESEFIAGQSGMQIGAADEKIDEGI
jgi:hypothetical protein